MALDELVRWLWWDDFCEKTLVRQVDVLKKKPTLNSQEQLCCVDVAIIIVCCNKKGNTKQNIVFLSSIYRSTIIQIFFFGCCQHFLLLKMLSCYSSFFIGKYTYALVDLERIASPPPLWVVSINIRIVKCWASG